MPAVPVDTSLIYALDDEQDNLDLLERTLASLCRLKTFADAASLLAAAQAERPDLVLLDQRLPITSGTEVLKTLRQNGVECGVVIVTAYPDAPEVRTAVDTQEAFWIVAKPWLPEQLSSQVTMALSLSRLRLRRSARDKVTS
jgi:DNA-binding NtrC family response regulator